MTSSSSTDAGGVAATPPHAASPAIVLRGIEKTYGDFFALRPLDIEFEPGAIHALVGQNGAGKSTCLGIIAGRTGATAGTLEVTGISHEGGWSAREATASGVAAVYQELSVFPAMTALENVFMGQMRSRAGFVDRPAMRRRFDELVRMLGVSVDANALVGSLPLAQQQIVEIMRGLAVDSRVLLLDEPTAVLGPADRAALFKVMRELRDQGVTIVFVSHYLDEVLAIADTVSVFRDGRLVLKDAAGKQSEATIVASMLGEEAAGLVAAADGHRRAAKKTGPTLLQVRGLSVGRVEGVDLHVRAGEIVGIGGLVGSGRSTVLRALSGAQPARGGAMEFDGKPVDLPRSPRAAWRMGIGYIPEDRKHSGLVLERSSRDNIAIGDLKKVSRAGFIDGALFRAATNKLADQYELATRAVDLPAGQLSGGNQQKVLFARWGLRRPSVLLADESTRGVDVGSKGAIMRTLRALADEGMGIIFVSSDLQEVAAVSDRIYVFKAGRMVGEFADTSGVTQDDILARAFGVEASN